MKPVKLGVIGLGNIGSLHAEYLMAGKVKRCELKAVAATSVEKLAPWQNRGLKVFTDGADLIRSGEVDAVIVATPISNMLPWASPRLTPACISWWKSPSPPIKRLPSV